MADFIRKMLGTTRAVAAICVALILTVYQVDTQVALQLRNYADEGEGTDCMEISN